MQLPEISKYPYYLPSFYSDMNSKSPDYPDIGVEADKSRLYYNRYSQPVTYDLAKSQTVYEFELPGSIEYTKRVLKNGSGISMNQIFYLILVVGILYILFRKFLSKN